MKIIPTGLAPMDYLLRGGLPKGKVVELHGPYPSLKSYIGLCAIANTQRSGKIAALIDTKGTFDPRWARMLGVDCESLLYKEVPDPVREPFLQSRKVFENLVFSGSVDLIVMDIVEPMMASYAEDEIKYHPNAPAVLWMNQSDSFYRVLNNDYCIVMEHVGIYYEEHVVYVRNEDRIPHKRIIKKKAGQNIWARRVNSNGVSLRPQTTFTYSLRRGGIDDWLYLCRLGIEAAVIGYDRGRWWLTEEPDKKYRTENFRSVVSTEALKEMMPMAGIGSSALSPYGRSKSVKRNLYKDDSSRPARKTIEIGR